jgi:hypothetical protein
LSKKWPIGRCIEFVLKKTNAAQNQASLSLLKAGGDCLTKSDTVEELLDQNLLAHGMSLFLEF